MCSDGAYVLERDRDPVTQFRRRLRQIDEVSPQLEGNAVARRIRADEVALLEERAELGVEVELHVGADAVLQQRRAGVEAHLAGARVDRRLRRLERREPGEAEVLVGAVAGAEEVRGERRLLDLV